MLLVKSKTLHLRFAASHQKTFPILKPTKTADSAAAYLLAK